MLFISWFALLSFIAYLTNPFQPSSIFESPFSTVSTAKSISLDQSIQLRSYSNRLSRYFALFKSAFHIVAASFKEEQPSGKTTIPEILNYTYELRLNPDTNPYIISGPNFSVYYPRNLGVFYHPTMDPYIEQSTKSWIRKQRAYLQSTAFALEGYDACKSLTTTIVPVGRKSIACINIYHYPSDALYSVLYALNTLTYNDSFYIYHPTEVRETNSILTQQTTIALTHQYKQTLEQLLDEYITVVYNPETGLVYKDVALSSAKDTIKRESAFYDNVIFWGTLVQADRLGLRHKDIDTDNLKQRIIQTFWDNKKGIFIEDLSKLSKEHSYYSSDWLIVLPTGFIHPFNESEMPYFKRSIAYIESHHIDKPFPIKYQESNRQDNTIPLVKVFASQYQSNSIWGFWGVEYIKMLYLVGSAENNSSVLQKADTFTNMYEDRITQDGGFAELYSSDGSVFDTFFYTSIRNTSWIVNFEQLLEMKKEFGIMTSSE